MIMQVLALDNVLFQTYLIAASLMVLKLVVQGWVTVVKVYFTQGGFLNPEDGKPSPMFFFVDESFLSSEEAVERSRRVHRNDLENIPAFLVAGFLFLFTEPSLVVTQGLLYGFVVVRIAHTISYEFALVHDLRATFYTVGSMITAYMAVCTIYFAWV